MTGSLVIAPRFCGPPNIGNGGYTAGLIAAYLDGPAEERRQRWRQGLSLPFPAARRLSAARGRLSASGHSPGL